MKTTLITTFTLVTAVASFSPPRIENHLGDACTVFDDAPDTADCAHGLFCQLGQIDDGTNTGICLDESERKAKQGQTCHGTRNVNNCDDDLICITIPFQNSKRCVTIESLHGTKSQGEQCIVPFDAPDTIDCAVGLFCKIDGGFEGVCAPESERSGNSGGHQSGKPDGKSGPEVTEVYPEQNVQPNELACYETEVKPAQVVNGIPCDEQGSALEPKYGVDSIPADKKQEYDSLRPQYQERAVVSPSSSGAINVQVSLLTVVFSWFWHFKMAFVL